MEIHLADSGLAAFAEQTLRGISLAGPPRFFNDTDGRFPITAAADDDHPLGLRVEVHVPGGPAVTYRIDAAGRIRLEEQACEGERIVTTVEEFARTTPGRLLPVRLTVTRRHAGRAAGIRSEAVRDSHCRRDHVWRPERRAVTINGCGPTHSWLLTLERHSLI